MTEHKPYIYEGETVHSLKFLHQGHFLFTCSMDDNCCFYRGCNTQTSNRIYNKHAWDKQAGSKYQNGNDNKYISCSWESANRTELSAIAVQQADDGYSSRGNFGSLLVLSVFNVFARWHQHLWFKRWIQV